MQQIFTRTASLPDFCAESAAPGSVATGDPCRDPKSQSTWTPAPNFWSCQRLRATDFLSISLRLLLSRVFCSLFPCSAIEKPRPIRCNKERTVLQSLATSWPCCEPIIVFLIVFDTKSAAPGSVLSANFVPQSCISLDCFSIVSFAVCPSVLRCLVKVLRLRTRLEIFRT